MQKTHQNLLRTEKPKSSSHNNLIAASEYDCNHRDSIKSPSRHTLRNRKDLLQGRSLHKATDFNPTGRLQLHLPYCKRGQPSSRLHNRNNRLRKKLVNRAHTDYRHPSNSSTKKYRHKTSSRDRVIVQAEKCRCLST